MALKARLKALLRLSLGLILLGILVYAVDFGQLREVITDVDVYWLIGVAVFPHLAIFVSVLKWQWLMRAQALNYPTGTLFKLYLIGTFFSNFLPSMVGGDVVRGYLLGVDRDTAPHVTAAIVVERLSGLAALIVLLVFGLLDRTLQTHYPLVVLMLAAIILVALVGAFAIMRGKRPRLGWLSSHPLLKNRVVDFLKRTQTQLADFRNHRTTVMHCFLMSFPFYFFSMAAVYSAGRAFGIEIELWALLVVVPVVLLIGLLPISINGMGVNETGWVVFLGLFGVTPALGLAIGLLLRARIILTSLVGGALYATLKDRIKTDECNAPGSSA